VIELLSEKIEILLSGFASSMRLPIQVQEILFRESNEKIQYLVMKRTPEREGFWQPVTGGLEEGETRVEALRREVLEETGIKDFVRIIEDVHYFEYSDSHFIKEYVFGVEISSKEKVLLDGSEHSEFRWCGFHEALDLLKWKENKEALSRLNEVLMTRK
jgi:dATP pyrophosphohydrolase